MALQLTCPACSATFALAEDMRGKKTFCPKCGDSLVITGAGVAKKNEGPNFNLDADWPEDGPTKGNEGRQPAARRVGPTDQRAVPPALEPRPQSTREPEKSRRWLLPLVTLLVLSGGGLAIYLLTRESPAKEKQVASPKNEPDKPKPQEHPSSLVLKEDTNSLGMKFVHLQKGTFYMGWDSEKKKCEKTEIKEDFEIGVYTVTQEQWQEVMGNNPSWFSRTGMGREKVKNIDAAELKQFPVENVTWNETQEFIKKLNEREQGKGWTYRLPSEAEWEYACRGGATSEKECSFDFYLDEPTNALSSDRANFDGRNPAGGAQQGKWLGRMTKVGSYKPNKLGLYDMHGNARQWCDDKFDGVGPDRVLRGGNWEFGGSICRAANRDGYAPGNRSGSHGFRLARVLSGDK